MILTAGEMASLRSDLEATLPDTCTVTRPTQVKNDAGGWTETPVVVATVACRVSPIGTRDAAIAQQIGASLDMVLQHVVTLPADTDVQQSDSITCTTRTFRVASMQDRVSEGLVRRIFVSEDV